MFNLTGGELLLGLLVALIVLGPDKLPEAMRRAGNIYGELKRMSHGFQSELRSALDEPSRELRDTADAARRLVEEPMREVRSTFTGAVGARQGPGAAASAPDVPTDVEVLPEDVAEARAPDEEPVVGEAPGDPRDDQAG